GFSMFKEGVQAYFMQQLDPNGGQPLTSAHLLHLATKAGAQALDLDDKVGDLSEGKRFDAVLVRPTTGQPLDVGITNAADDEDALAKLFAMGTPSDIAGVWIDGQPVKSAHIHGVPWHLAGGYRLCQVLPRGCIGLAQLVRSAFKDNAATG